MASKKAAIKSKPYFKSAMLFCVRTGNVAYSYSCIMQGLS